MKINIDKKADAVYIEFAKGKFFSNKKLDEDTVLDLDKDGHILGIELLSASKRMPLDKLKSCEVNLIS